MKRKEYITPTMKVMLLKHRTCLLYASRTEGLRTTLQEEEVDEAW